MASYTADDLEILIATMDREDLSFLEPIFSKSVDNIDVKVLVVNQSKTSKLASHRPNIRVINDAHKGLSRSRNLAIKNATGRLLWILDDDCKILPGAFEMIAAAHEMPYDVITFQTLTKETGTLFWDYPTGSQLLNNFLEKNTLSPEITFKKSAIGSKHKFDERFGLGAPFEDGENYVFLKSLGTHGLSGYYCNEPIVQHPSNHSSMEATSQRLIYARGAMAQYEGKLVQVHAIKYALFLFRKGLVTNFKSLYEAYHTFLKGASDFKSMSAQEILK